MSQGPGVCARCHRGGPRHARNLCHPCHRHETLAGQLLEYPTSYERNTDRNARVVAMLKSGQSVTDTAAALGLTYDTVRSLARVGGLVGGGGSVGGYVATAPMPKAPGRSPCYGAEMYPRDTVPAAQLHPARNLTIRAGLELCATCPRAMRQHCLDVVDPQGLGKEWQGIAGGVVWSSGSRVFPPIELAEAAS